MCYSAFSEEFFGGERIVLASTAVFGVAFVDVKGFPFNAYIPTGTNLGTVKIVHGGVSRNVCEDFANIGMPVDFVSVSDRSCIGQDVVTHLDNIGVGVEYITWVENNGIGMWLAVMNERGDLAGSTSQMPDVDSLESFIGAKGEEIISKCENVVLEIDMSESIAEKVIELAEKYNKKVYVISGNMSVILKRKDLLSRVSCFICNEIEAGRLFRMELSGSTPREMLGMIKERSKAMRISSMIVTMGSVGSVYLDNAAGEEGMCSSYPCKIVDTTGAGDAFFSGTVMGLTRGYNIGKAVKAGTKLAAMTIQVEESSCPKNPRFFDEFD